MSFQVSFPHPRKEESNGSVNLDTVYSELSTSWMNNTRKPIAAAPNAIYDSTGVVNLNEYRNRKSSKCNASGIPLDREASDLLQSLARRQGCSEAIALKKALAEGEFLYNEVERGGRLYVEKRNGKFSEIRLKRVRDIPGCQSNASTKPPSATTTSGIPLDRDASDLLWSLAGRQGCNLPTALKKALAEAEFLYNEVEGGGRLLLEKRNGEVKVITFKRVRDVPGCR